MSLTSWDVETANLLQQRIYQNQYIPHSPTVKQATFLVLTIREVLYGGAAGGGKSDALLMGALMYVDQPGYAAIIFRRTFTDLMLPGALIPRSIEWLWNTDAQWNDRDKQWSFPSGATLNFGYLQTARDMYRYQSSEFQFIGWDELTQFPETPYRYLFSRLRRLEGSEIPLRNRSASNPGGEGHAWVYERFVVNPNQPERAFVPAGLSDNPHIDRAEYEQSLGELDDITRAQLLAGVWITDPAGRPYQREWWRGQNRYDVTDKAHAQLCIGRWISWDTAFKDTSASDFTAYTVAELLPTYCLYIRKVHRDKTTFPELPDDIRRVAKQWNYDGKLKAVLIEDKASGISAIQTLRATAPDWLVQRLVAFQPKGSKLERAKQAAVWAKRGCVFLPQPSNDAPWLHDFEQELFNFPDVQHDDQVDTLDQLVLYLEYYLAEGWRARTG